MQIEQLLYLNQLFNVHGIMQIMNVKLNQISAQVKS